MECEPIGNKIRERAERKKMSKEDLDREMVEYFQPVMYYEDQQTNQMSQM